ncbi:MAG: triose-phosphate isomerase [Proteobacteria bacterium]|nr:triose-phosphate isomerase [Pseudomonadota bacterium]
MIVVVNWKMNQLRETLSDYYSHISDYIRELSLVICPPYPYLDQCSKLTNQYNSRGISSLYLGAQNVGHQSSGAYTGEISAAMLKDFGVSYSLVGHMERRTIFQENTLIIKQKIICLQHAGIIPILCFGDDPTSDPLTTNTKAITETIKNTLDGLDKPSSIILAYEPGWAIGGDETPPREVLEEIFFSVRSTMTATLGQDMSRHVPLLYGGGVRENNIHRLLPCRELDGFLCGGVSLKSKTLSALLNKIVTHGSTQTKVFSPVKSG